MPRRTERGRPTVHTDKGLGVGILTGDLALVMADEVLLGSGFEPDVLQPAFEVYSRMRREVIVGQYLDSALDADPDAFRRAGAASGRA